MPKFPPYILAWSEARETYELSETQGQRIEGITLESPAWFSWLKDISCFTFVGKNGHYTARQETRRRGGRYWLAYRTHERRLRKRYLGKSADLTQERLESVAALLGGASEGEHATQTLLTPAASQSTPSANYNGDQSRPSGHNQQLDPFHSLLATRLNPPRLRTQLVFRTRLVEHLQQGIEGPLILVSAPAGSGKTTALAQWLQNNSLPFAWLSLEPEDNNPTYFLSSIIAALQTVDDRLGNTVLEMLCLPQPPPLEAMLAMLINELAHLGRDEIALVLDDYHVITDVSTHQVITILLKHLPPQIHLVLSTRVDPPLPLARLRAGGKLTEIRTAELRFAPAEACTFLQEVMKLDLPAEAIVNLEKHTEGWIAGLQLAAISLRGGKDIASFLESFSGCHRFVLDYLSDEVLAQQSAEVREFLLHTSILTHLCGPLCDAVTGQEGSQPILEALEKANLFVFAMDDERRWYRYHHMFIEVLHNYLQQEKSTEMEMLHRRASTWYEQNNMFDEAVQHALAIPDFELAARLIEPIVLSIAHHGHRGQVSKVLGWLHALPEVLAQAHPLLWIYHGLLLMYANQMEAAEIRLREVEQSIPAEIQDKQASIIRGSVYAIRGRIAVYTGRMADAVSLAHQALSLLPSEEVYPRTGALAIAIYELVINGDATSGAEDEILNAVALISASDHLFVIVFSIYVLARLYILQGKLHRASATYTQLMQVAPQSEMFRTMFPGLYYYFGQGDLLREWNKLDEAEQYVVQGIELIDDTLPVHPSEAVLGYTTLALLQQERGNTKEALVTLDALVHLAEQRHLIPHVRIQEESMRVRIKLMQNHVSEAIRWADQSSLSTRDTNLPYHCEMAYLTLARVRIVQAQDDPTSPLLQDALHLLDRLLREAEAKARMGSVLEILIVRALALAAQKNRTEAIATLERALVLAQPEGYVRLFIDEGDPIRNLLLRAQFHSAVPEYVTTLLQNFGEHHASASVLAEPLTERECEVLRLSLEGVSNREIAHRLVLSVSTVKRHIYNVCGKLGVHSRAQALIRARDLNLV